MRRFFYICVGFFAAFFLVYIGTISGCKHDNNTTVFDPPTQGIQNAGVRINNATTQLSDTTKDIKTNTDQIVIKTPEPTKTAIRPHTDAIIKDVGVQEQLVKEFTDTKTQLEATEQKSKEFEKKFSEEQARRIKAEEDIAKEFRHKVQGWSAICFFGALLSGAAIFFVGGIAGTVGTSIARGICGVCTVGLLVCVFLIQTIALIPYVVIGGCVIVAGMLIWTFYQKHKQVRVTKAENTDLKVATQELTETVEASKPYMSLEGRKDFFGDGPIPGRVQSLQRSNKTRDIVKAHRANMSNLAPKVDETIATDVGGEEMRMNRTFRTFRGRQQSIPSNAGDIDNFPTAPAKRRGGPSTTSSTTRQKIILT